MLSNRLRVQPYCRWATNRHFALSQFLCPMSMPTCVPSVANGLNPEAHEETSNHAILYYWSGEIPTKSASDRVPLPVFTQWGFIKVICESQFVSPMSPSTVRIFATTLQRTLHACMSEHAWANILYSFSYCDDHPFHQPYHIRQSKVA